MEDRRREAELLPHKPKEQSVYKDAYQRSDAARALRYLFSFHPFSLSNVMPLDRVWAQKDN
jgi:hypothetical protein